MERRLPRTAAPAAGCFLLAGERRGSREKAHCTRSAHPAEAGPESAGYGASPDGTTSKATAQHPSGIR